MKAGTPVRNHMMVIISYLKKREILGSEIDEETKIDMIVETLPESVDTLKLNYSMNKLEYTVTELMKELHTAEGLTKKRGIKERNMLLSTKPPPLDLRRDLTRPRRRTVLPISKQRNIVLY